ncbi:MAG: protein translocase subunit SecD [Treponema sp.]|jgi:preprotein translocase subunit SecD|nr:protein translocase subunit SecD [Treponema sp.]
MKKRYRFLLILAIIGFCFIFLLPSVRWYFFTPKLDQTQALGSREQIKSYASQTAQDDLEKLISAARSGGGVPDELSFMIDEAKRVFKDAKKPAPEQWDAGAVLSAFLSRQEALEFIEAKYRNKIFNVKDTQKNSVQLGLDLSGGLSIVLQADMDALQEKLNRPLTDEDSADAMLRALDSLNNKIDAFGLTEPVIRQQGSDQIYVEIPGAADPERINSIIRDSGSLVFHIVDEEATAEFNNYYRMNPSTTIDSNGVLLNPNSVPLDLSDVMVLGVYKKDLYGIDEQIKDANGNRAFMVVKREVGLDGSHIQEASVQRNSIDGRPEVKAHLDYAGGERFKEVTKANIGKPMAIILDNRIKSYPVIQGELGDTFVITGFSVDEAQNIALTLKTAALPVKLDVVSQQSIGASLGEDTIRQGLYALLGGLALVLVFMLIYYKSAGINAIVAQILNIYLMFSILSAFNFTLTLPSIAGFILTIGMAVDASVIIFERMKEEIRLGKGRKAVIENGFDKAFWSIMDANITTFIAALFLSQLGKGPIQGFAVSLAIGIFSSVFTALFVSRLIFDIGTDVFKSKGLSISWFTKMNTQANAEGVK